MTRRPLLILNGKPTRYCQLSIIVRVRALTINQYQIHIDDEWQQGATVSYSTRRSGRRMIYVDVPEVE